MTGKPGVILDGSAISRAAPRPVTVWRLEWLRLVRTPRAVSLLAVFVAIGLIEPVFVRYQNDLLAHVGRGLRVSVPPPAPADGLTSFISQAMLIGLIIVVMLTASAVSFDSRPGMATFLRTRSDRMWPLLAPRVTASAVAAIAAYWLGTAAAWVQTSQLIGPLPAGRVLAGALCGAVYLAFAVAVTALAAGIGRGTLAAGAIGLGILLGLSALGVLRVLSRWLPSTLAGAAGDLASGVHPLSYYLPALLIAIGASAAALALATWRLGAREI